MEEQITTACSALSTSIGTVKLQFSDKEIKQINLSGKKEQTAIVEIRFEKTTLTCMFNHRNICCAVYLFFDNQNDICEYIAYCDQTYKYDNELYSWINNNCYIWLYIENEMPNIVFSSLKPLRGCLILDNL